MSEILQRKFVLTGNSYDPETRTFEAVISTGAPVARADSRGAFTERLDLSSVDPASLVGMTVLDGHRQSGSEHAVGSIIEARREGERIVAKVRLSAADDVKSLALKIGEGTIRGVSIGYSAQSRTESVERTNGKRTVTVRPKIHELSVVAIPADPLAIIRKEEPPMPENSNESAEASANDNALERRQEIRLIARTFGFSPEWADEQIDSDIEITEIRSKAFDLAMRSTSPSIRTAAPANDDPNVIAQRRADALFARVNGTAPADECRQYFNDGLVDHARAFLTMAGQSVVGMDRETLLRAAQHTTSDFTNLLTGVGNRTLMPAYQAAQSPLKRVARQVLLSDFRTSTRLKLSEVGQLAKVSESGEITSTTRGEAAEAYALDTYASMFSLSRKALINDDLGAFRDWGMAAGKAAAETEASLLFDLLTQANGAGPTMGEDNKAMFHADHGNIGNFIGSYPVGTDSLSEARQAMREQKGLDGVTPIAVAPKYLLVGPALETEAEKSLTQITAAASIGDANPFGGKFELLVEPRLTDVSWYMFSDPAVLACLEYAYLSLAQGPQMASREGWDVLGMEFRVVLDFGCGAVDWRGAFRNPGA